MSYDHGNHNDREMMSERTHIFGGWTIEGVAVCAEECWCHKYKEEEE